MKLLYISLKVEDLLKTFQNLLAVMQLENVIFLITKHLFKRCRVVSQYVTAARSSPVFFIFEIPDVHHTATWSIDKKKKKMSRMNQELVTKHKQSSMKAYTGRHLG